MTKKRKKLIIEVLLLILFSLVLIRFPYYASSSEAAPLTTNQDSLCMSCHGSENCEADISPNSLEISAHKSLMCTNCHINPHVKTDNLILDMNNRCTNCHASVCTSNVHSESLQGGAGALCTDCHGIHDIKLIKDPESRVYRLNVSNTCINCHEEKQEAYQYSFHGTAVELGSMKAANCVDCHGSHDILSPSNPSSSVYEENIPTTCAKCHEKAQPNFAKGKEHVTPYDRENAFPLWVIWKVFIVIILIDVIKDGTIAIFELIKKLRKKNDSEKKDDPKTWDI